MIRTLYHGSEKNIEKPLFGGGKRYNDYGRGFYCTESLEMAKEWGVSRGQDGFANIYELECDGLQILDLSSSEYCVLNWLSILLENREFDISSVLAKEAKEYLLKNFLVPYKDYDAIVGYRADDSYFSFAQDFLNGSISYGQLGNAMKLGKLGMQFVLKSRRAFERLQYVGYETAKWDVWYPKKSQRDRKARRAYFDGEKNKRQRGDLYIVQILDEEIKQNDERL